MAFLIGGANSAADTAYNIDNSCRFDRASSDAMSISSLSSGSTTTGTQSWWFKRSGLSTDQRMWANYAGSDSERNQVGWQSADKLYIQKSGSASRISTQVFRDVSAWYHIVCAWDSTQASAGNRLHVYINGSEITAWDTNVTLTEDAEMFLNNDKIIIGERETSDLFFDGYLAEFHSVDGQQLDADDFGETDEDSGIWKPKEYTGSYGTNGFFLDFADSGDLGDDESGNGKDFTESNIDATNQCTDTPTNNFCTLNPLIPFKTSGASVADESMSEGNTALTGYDGSESIGSTMAVANGKWYYEYKVTDCTNAAIGFTGQTTDLLPTDYPGENGYAYAYGMATTSTPTGITNNGTKQNIYRVAWVDGDIAMIAWDTAANKMWIGKNGTWLDSGDPAAGTASPAVAGLSATADSPSGANMPSIRGGSADGATNYVNFGNPAYANSSSQSDDNGYGDFEYDPPTGFYALCSKNLAKYG